MRHLFVKHDQESEGFAFCFPSSSADRVWSAAQKLRRSGAPRWFLLGKYSPIAPLPALTHFTRGFGNARPGKCQAAQRGPVKPEPEEAALIFTVLAGVVHQDDLLQEDGRGGVQDAVHGPQQGAPGFIVKHDDHAGGWQGGAPLEGLLNTSVAKRAWRKKKHKDLPVLSSSPARLLRLHALPGGVFLSAATAHVSRLYQRGRTLIHLDKRARTQSSFTSASCNQQVLECTPACQTQHVPLSQLAAAGARTHNFKSLSGLTSLRFLPEISCKHTRVKKQTSVKREMCVFFRSA